MNGLKPNIFQLATSELSQDTIITWLLQWANPHVREMDPGLHKCGSALLDMLIAGQSAKNTPVKYIEAGRQWENIDIWAEIHYENGEKLLLIIEDKTYSGEHSEQLLRYKATAQQWCDENKSELACCYIKIGSESRKVLDAIAEKGFEVFDRNRILGCLRQFSDIKDSFLTDYVAHLQHLEDAHQLFKTTPPAEWNKHPWAWVGFYQYVESQMPIHMWHRVNNPSGGFWNLCLNWEYWHSFPVYMQLEQGKFCFKIAVAAYETDHEPGEIDVDRVQDFVHSQLLEFGRKMSVPVYKPYRHMHSGDYRTFATVEQEYWLGGEATEIIDLGVVIHQLKKMQSFCRSFLDYMGAISYEEAGLITHV